jgi:hypothetical protein
MFAGGLLLAILTLLAIQSGALPSLNTVDVPEPRHFKMRVAADGSTKFSAAEGASKQVKSEIMGVTYDSPEEAMHAVQRDFRASWVNYALAHAVKVCTHRDNVISNSSGTSRHRTNFVKHTNSSHVTKTLHEFWTQVGWVVGDSFTSYASRRYCNC